MKGGVKNKTINYINIHFGLQRFAETIALTFGPIYLYKIGISIPWIFLIWAAMFGTRFFIRPFMLQLLPKIGLKKSIIIGSIIYAITYPSFLLINGLNFALLLPILLVAIVDVSYWLPYHTYFGIMGDSEDRGKQHGVRNALIQIGNILAPLLGGSLMYYYGFIGNSLIAFLFFIICLIPLFFIEEVFPKKAFSFKEGLAKTGKRGFVIYGLEGFTTATFHFTWVLVLYFLMGENTLSTGGVIALTTVIHIIVSYFIGHNLDLQHEANDAITEKTKKRMLQHTPFYLIGGIMSFIGIIGKTFFTWTLPSILLVEVFVMLSQALLSPYINVIVYNEQKESEQPLWYQYLAETGWDVGSVFGYTAIAALVYFGGDLRYGMLFALITLPVLIWSLSPWYKTKMA